MNHGDKKILLIGRHGRSPQNQKGGSVDTLLDAAVRSLYHEVGIRLRHYVEEYGLEPKKTFLRHTRAKRTRYTGQAILTGAFNLKPASGTLPPQTVADLGAYDFAHFGIAADLQFNLCTPNVNLKVYKEQGAGACINYWLANPYTTFHDGQSIGRYTSVLERVGRGLEANIHTLLEKGKDLGIIVTHATVIEPALILLVDSIHVPPERKHINSIEEIGGAFNAGEFMQLTFERIAGNWACTVMRGEAQYPVNLYRFHSDMYSEETRKVLFPEKA